MSALRLGLDDKEGRTTKSAKMGLRFGGCTPRYYGSSVLGVHGHHGVKKYRLEQMIILVVVVRLVVKPDHETDITIRVRTAC